MRYAISDIHGCPKTLDLALQTVGLNKDDELFLLGDYVDRGPDSAGTLRYIWQLEDDGYQLVCLRGNHEQMVLDFADRNGPRYDWFPQQKDLLRTLSWMNELAHYHETPGYLLVHAGFNFRRKDPLQDKDAMLWERYWYDDMVLRPDFPGEGRIIVHGHTPAKMLEIRASIRYMTENRYTCIDSGCSQQLEGMGYLTVLNLDTREGTFVRRVD